MKTQVAITITNEDGSSVQLLTEDELRDKALRTALDLILSDYPEDLSNEWVIDGILNGDNRIEVWEPFENRDPEDLVDQIEGFAHIIYHTYFQ